MEESKTISIVFDGPPSTDGPHFIGVEDDKGRSTSCGVWKQVGADWHLEILNPGRIQGLESRVEELEKDVRLRDKRLVIVREARDDFFKKCKSLRAEVDRLKIDLGLSQLLAEQRQKRITSADADIAELEAKL